MALRKKKFAFIDLYWFLDKGIKERNAKVNISIFVRDLLSENIAI